MFIPDFDTVSRTWAIVSHIKFSFTTVPVAQKKDEEVCILMKLYKPEEERLVGKLQQQVAC